MSCSARQRRRRPLKLKILMVTTCGLSVFVFDMNVLIGLLLQQTNTANVGARKLHFKELKIFSRSNMFPKPLLRVIFVVSNAISDRNI